MQILTTKSKARGPVESLDVAGKRRSEGIEHIDQGFYE